jgi:hypothetical protein
MKTKKLTGAPPNDTWKRAYNDAICEFEFSVREQKVELARRMILDEIENALHAGYSHPTSNELRIALNVIDTLSASPLHPKNFRPA